jgi:hypothetical protein
MVIGKASLLVSQPNAQVLAFMFIIEISFYLTEAAALHHFRELVGLKPS